MTNLKYQEHILPEFKKLNMQPRQHQVKIINDILTQYLDNNKKNVILSASTGIGKSIIAVIVSEVLQKIENPNDIYNKSYILMHNNTLVQQYSKTFDKNKDFLIIKGASNYECKHTIGTGQDCIFTKQKMNIRFPRCKGCKYDQMLKRIDTTDNIITNYSYYLINKLFKTNRVKESNITIYDECHLLNQIFCNTLKIEFNSKRLSNIQKLIEIRVMDRDIVKSLIKMVRNIMKQIPKLTESNYKVFLNDLLELYSELYDYFYSVAKDNMKSDIETFKIYNKVANNIRNNNLSRIRELVENEYEHIVDIQKDGITIEPIFMDSKFDTIRNSKYNLFMSATINKDYLIETVGLNENQTSFIHPLPVFPKQNKKITFINHTSYNYTSLQDENVLHDMSQIIRQCLEYHKNQNGIIITPSFMLNEIIYHNLISSNIPIKHKIFLHNPDEHLNKVLQKFIESDTTSVLISPSLYEGIDLYGDLSKFQIIVKAPYTSLANKRIKYIANNHPKVYSQDALYKIIQGAGRSNRNINEVSNTYCLDTNISKLFNGVDNIWQNEFLIK